MSSSICQGLQSCLEPGLVTEPRVSRLKLAPPMSNFSPSFAGCKPCSFTDPAYDQFDDPKPNKPHNEENTTTIIATASNKNNDYDPKRDQNIDMGGWSFLQSLSNNTSSNRKRETTESDKVYVHPLVKSSSSILSKKSLEMCTESLGSETGSEVSENSDDMSLLISLESTTKDSLKQQGKNLATRKRMTARSTSFPPPITSISVGSGGGGVKVRSHREGGRLVLQAVTVPSSNAYFHAERSEGRLRLSFLGNSPNNSDNEEAEEEEENAIEEEEKEYDEEEFDIEEEEEEEEEEDEEVGGWWGEDIEGNSGNAEGKMTMRKLGRPSRCKEGGRGHKGLLNWESYLGGYLKAS